MKNYRRYQDLGFFMQDIIHELLEIDSDAQKLTDEAQARRREVRRIIDEGKAALIERYRKEAEERLENLKKSSSESAQRTVEAVREKSTRSIAALRAAFDQNGEKWADAIYRAVIGRE